MNMQISWEKLASNILKAEIKRREITYQKLQEKLAEIGTIETANSINVKINRGAFSLAFFLQCAVAIDMKTLRLDDIFEEIKK